MTDSAKARQARIAVFDLDRTLTKRGSHTPFILFCLSRRPWRAYWVPLVLLYGLGYAAKSVSRDTMKSIMLRAVLGGAQEEQARGLGLRFAKHWVDREMRRSLQSRLVRHQTEGERVILATAAFDLYAEPIADALGIPEILSTKVHIDSARRLTGRISGANCFGSEKLKRVREALPEGPDSCYLTVYSDDESDFELLRSADQGIAVHPKHGFRGKAQDAGLEIIED